MKFCNKCYDLIRQIYSHDLNLQASMSFGTYLSLFHCHHLDKMERDGKTVNSLTGTGRGSEKQGGWKVLGE